MARTPQDAIETFVSITGSSEAVAVQRLEEHGGDLNEAVNAHFNAGDRINTFATSAAIAHNDLMDIDDLIDVEFAGHFFPLLAAGRSLNTFSLLNSNIGRRFRDGGSFASVFSRSPQVSHPREMREIPIKFKDTNPQSESSGRGPTIEEVTGNIPSHGPEVHGTVILEDDEDDILEAPDHGIAGSRDGSYERGPAPIAPSVDMTDYSNDTEEEMLKVAIEASKRDAENSTGSEPIEISPLEDVEIERAISLSLKTAEQEKVPLREQGAYNSERSNLPDMNEDEAGKVTKENERQGPDFFNTGTTSQLREKGNLYLQEEAEDVQEHPSTQHSGEIAGNAESAKSVQLIDSPSLSTQQNDIENLPQLNGDDIHTDEWGGISSEEHDEAVMLEAVMFGGIPERAAYPMAYPSHRVLQTDFGSSSSYYPWMRRPSSPMLTAQRLLREQQDDEYLAALQADRKKELKAEQEAEAAFEREKHQEEETQRKQLEEEELERKLTSKEASLSQEPSADDGSAVTLLVRMPDGSRRGRRFLKSDRLQLLFDYIDVGRVVKPGTYRLVRPYPRRAFTDGESNLSFGELGLTSKQEALFIELI